MYLKKVNGLEQKQLHIIMPFCSGVWYQKMNEDGTAKQNERDSKLYTCMIESELKLALENKEFTKVEK